MLVASIGGTTAQQPSATNQNARLHLVDMLNARRAEFGFKPLQPSTELDLLAQSYSDEIVAARNFTIEPLQHVGFPVLYQAVGETLGEGGFAFRHVGMTIGYGIGVELTFQTMIMGDVNRPALIDNVMDIVGVGAATVGEGRPWLASPPGGDSPPVELTGYTVVVIITAGDF